MSLASFHILFALRHDVTLFPDDTRKSFFNFEFSEPFANPLSTVLRPERSRYEKINLSEAWTGSDADGKSPDYIFSTFWILWISNRIFTYAILIVHNIILRVKRQKDGCVSQNQIELSSEFFFFFLVFLLSARHGWGPFTFSYRDGYPFSSSRRAFRAQFGLVYVDVSSSTTGLRSPLRRRPLMWCIGLVNTLGVGRSKKQIFFEVLTTENLFRDDFVSRTISGPTQDSLILYGSFFSSSW